MKYLIKNNRGMTLVEVVAVLIIISIAASLIFGIVQSSAEEKVQQTKQTNDLFDITYALKVLTKDIRRSEQDKASATPSELTLTFKDPTDVNYDVTYFLKDGQLIKKTVHTGEKFEVITDGINCAQFNLTNNVISIELSNTSNCSEGKKAEIHLRKGS